MELFRASNVFREGAENCARGGRAPHFSFGIRAECVAASQKLWLDISSSSSSSFS